MKIVQVNATSGCGSIGKICESISKLLTKNGIENYILYSSGHSDYPLAKKYTSDFYIKAQALITRINGLYGFNSRLATLSLIKELDEIKPEIIHLHNLHSHNVNLDMLFKYIKNNHIKVFWTFHDCWAFTAYCPYFTYAHCEQWKTECNNCGVRKEYSWFFDKSSALFRKKKYCFENVDLTIVTPSQWLAGVVKHSFLSDYPVKVINNGIDLDVFKPTKSNFRQVYGIPDHKFIVLGVAFGWGARKGLDIFIKLSQELSSDYQIVLVGTNEQIDKDLPSNIISIHRTNNQIELAEIYTAANIFVNPTREDNYPTVNMEALACGTPVITSNAGGSSEIIDEYCGITLLNNDIISLKNEIINMRNSSTFLTENCIKRAAYFDENCRYLEYLNLLTGANE